jgi:phosphoribosylanthranilate isomerase
VTRVKLCGNRTAADVAAGAAAGADALGLIVATTHRSEDALQIADARLLLREVPVFVTPVLVTHLTTCEAIARLHELVPAPVLQLQADLAAEEARCLRASLPQVQLIQAVHVIDAGAVAAAERKAPLFDALLLDSRTEDRLGGTGRTHDWSISRRIVTAVAGPVILAGGLTPDNVGEAISRVAPYGVDVNSGVDGTGGGRDAERAAAFVRAVRRSSPS